MQDRRRIIGIAGFAGTGKDTLADVFVARGAIKVGLADPVKRAARSIFDFPIEHLWGPSGNRSIPDKRYLRGFGGLGWVCRTCCEAAHKGQPFEEKTLGGIGPRSCAAKCGITLEAKDMAYTHTPEFLTPRLALQRLGTEMGRECYQNVWVDHLLRTHDQLMQPPTPVQGGTVVSRYHYTNGVWPEAIMGDRTMPPPPSCVVVPDVRFANEVEGIRAAGGLVIRIHRGGVDAPYQHASELELKSIPDNAFDFVFFNNGTLEDFLRDSEDVVRVALARFDTLG